METGAVVDRSVDVVIPVYNEQPERVREMIAALSAQTHAPTSILVVDDASDAPLVIDGAGPRARVVRMRQNGGVSAARNEGVRHGSSSFVACVNAEVVPDPDWIERSVDYLLAHASVGVVSARTLPRNENSLMGRWRRLVQEPPYPPSTGPMEWVPGHALVFRRDAYEQVGGFDERMKRAGEDVDISFRLRRSGWDVHFIDATLCRSMQADTPAVFARAEYNRFCWRQPTGNGLLRCAWILSSRTAQRAAKHLLWGRWALLPVELLVWLQSLRLAWQKR